MAIKAELWLEAKTMFEMDSSLSDIEKKTGINRSSVSKKAKKEGWEKAKNQQLKSEIVDFEGENSTLLKKKSTLVEKVASLDDFEITYLHDLVDSETKQKSVLFSTLNLAVIRSNQQLSNNTKEVAIKTKESYGGGAGSETIERINLELDGNDIKNHVESLVKAGQSMGIISTKPDVAIQNNNTNTTPSTINYIEDKGQ